MRLIAIVAKNWPHSNSTQGGNQIKARYFVLACSCCCGDNWNIFTFDVLIRSIFRLNRRHVHRCHVKNPNGYIFFVLSLSLIFGSLMLFAFRNLFLLTLSVLNITILFLFYVQIVINFKANVTFEGMLRIRFAWMCSRLLLLLAGWLADWLTDWFAACTLYFA